MSIEQELRERLPEETVAFGPIGSRLHGLEREDSDYDFLAITSDKKSRKQAIAGEFDIHFVSLSAFLERFFFKPSFPEICLLSSGKLQVLKEEYAPLLGSLRMGYLSAYKTFQNYSDHTEKLLSKCLEKDDSKKADKALQVIVRNSLLSEKLLREKQGFSPVFSAEEKKRYFQMLQKEKAARGL